MRDKILLATKNKGKIREIKSILSDMDIEVVSLDEVDSLPDVEEDGKTFYENALKKAKEIAEATDMMTLADDSGLEVDVLGGDPGVYSARYAGDNATDDDNNRRLLDTLRDVPVEKRTARFRCVIVVYHPSGKWMSAEGTCEGIITDQPKGEGGFGYDPIFLLPKLGRTMAELSPDEKNSLSHRANALKSLKKELPQFLESVN